MFIRTKFVFLILCVYCCVQNDLRMSWCRRRHAHIIIVVDEKRKRNDGYKFRVRASVCTWGWWVFGAGNCVSTELMAMSSHTFWNKVTRIFLFGAYVLYSKFVCKTRFKDPQQCMYKFIIITTSGVFRRGLGDYNSPPKYLLN